MTRKTFVKKMMGLGYSRNEANSLAARANRYGISYAQRWAYEKSALGSLKRASRKVGKAAKKATTALQRCARQAVNMLAAVKLSKLGIQAFEPALAAEWEKVPQHHVGLRTHVVLVDELAASAPALTHEQVKATTAKWPGTTVMVGVDLANGPDVAAEITVAGGAENAD